MEIRSAAKAKHKKTQIASSNSKKSSSKSMLKKKYTITIQLNSLFYEELQNMISSWHTAGDYSHGGTADIIRDALDKYREGAKLTELAVPGDKESLSIKIDEEQKAFYDSFAKRFKSEIVERATRSYVKTL